MLLSWRENHSSPNSFEMTKARIIRWAGHLERTGRQEKHTIMLFEKPKGKRPLGILTRWWEGNFKMFLRKAVVDLLSTGQLLWWRWWTFSLYNGFCFWDDYLRTVTWRLSNVKLVTYLLRVEVCQFYNGECGVYPPERNGLWNVNGSVVRFSEHSDKPRVL